MGYRKNDKEEAKDGKGVGAQDEGFPAGGRADNAADSLSRHGLKTGVWTDGEFMDRGWIPNSFPIKMINYPENFRSPHEQVAEVGHWVRWALDQEHPILIPTHSPFVFTTLGNMQLEGRQDGLDGRRDTYRFYSITEMGQFKDLVDGDGLASKNPMNDCLQALLEDQPRPTIFVAPRK